MVKTLKKPESELESPLEEISLQEKFKLARASMSSVLVERDAEIDLVLTALIAHENPLLVGPPGCGKSLLLDNLARWVDTKSFNYLLTKFTDPMELFGPIDLQALKNNEYRRVVQGYLPTVIFAFMDEIFKGSSAIRNTLLKILNERTFTFGLQEIQCPLAICVAGSNEWPSDDNENQESGALFDRFLLRKTVRPVSKTGRKALLAKAIANDDCQPIYSCTISPQELHKAHEEALELPWEDDAKKALWAILEELSREKINPSDRRIKKSVGIARASAYLWGAQKVQPEHLEVLMHVLWDDPEEQPDKCERIVAKIANPLGAVVLELQSQAQDIEEKAEKQLSEITAKHDREGVCRGVIAQLDEIRTDLKTRRQDARRDKVLDYINEAWKTWNYKLIGANRE